MIIKRKIKVHRKLVKNGITSQIVENLPIRYLIHHFAFVENYFHYNKKNAPINFLPSFVNHSATLSYI